MADDTILEFHKRSPDSLWEKARVFVLDGPARERFASIGGIARVELEALRGENERLREKLGHVEWRQSMFHRASTVCGETWDPNRPTSAIEELEEQYNDVLAENRELAQRISDLEMEKRSMEEQLKAEAEETLRGLREHIEACEKENEGLKEEIRQHEARRDTLVKDRTPEEPPEHTEPRRSLAARKSLARKSLREAARHRASEAFLLTRTSFGHTSSPEALPALDEHPALEEHDVNAPESSDESEAEHDIGLEDRAEGALEEEVKTLKAQVQDRDSEILRLQEEVVQSTMNQQLMARELNDVEELHREVEDMLASERSRNEYLQQEVERLENNQSQEKMLDIAHKWTDAAKQGPRVSSSDMLVNDLQAELADQDGNDVEFLREELAELREELSVAKQQKSELQCKAEEHTAQLLHEQRQKVEELRQQADSLRTQLATASQPCAPSEQAAADRQCIDSTESSLQQQLASATQKAEDLRTSFEEERAERNRENAELRDECERLRVTVAAHLQECDKLRVQLASRKDDTSQDTDPDVLDHRHMVLRLEGAEVGGSEARRTLTEDERLRLDIVRLRAELATAESSANRWKAAAEGPAWTAIFGNWACGGRPPGEAAAN